LQLVPVVLDLFLPQPKKIAIRLEFRVYGLNM